jgi:hypothetical protein
MHLLNLDKISGKHIHVTKQTASEYHITLKNIRQRLNFHF